MTNDRDSKAKHIAKKARTPEEEVIPDFPPPEKSEAGVAPRIEHFTPEGEIDPREDVISPEVKNEDEANAEASADYLPPDQPLAEKPGNKGRSKRAQRQSRRPKSPERQERKSQLK